MAFNFGAFAGGAWQGAQQGFNLYKNVKNFNEQQQLQKDLAHAPTVGADNTQYVFQDPTVKQVTPADRDEYIQNAILKDTGNVDSASRYALQSKQGQYYGAETQGKQIDNGDKQGAVDALKSVYGNHQAVSGLVNGIATGQPGATDAGFKYLQDNGVAVQRAQDGSMSIDGHPFNPNDVGHWTGALSAAMGNANLNALRSSGIQGFSLANEQQKTNATTTQANAAMQNSDTQRMVAPSEIARNQGSAAQSNAEASLAPSRMALMGAQANAAQSEVGLHNAQAGYYGAETSNLGLQQNYDRNSQAIQAEIEAKAKADPNYMGSPANQQDIARLNLSSKPNIYGRFTTDVNNNATKLAVAQSNNAGRLTVQSMKNQGAAGKGGSTFRQDAANPNVWHDTHNPGRAMVFDPKTGNIAKIAGIPAPKGTATDPTTGLPTATSKGGQAGYLRADGQWDSDPNSALATYGPAGVPSQNPGNSQVVKPPLPTAPQSAMPGYTGLPS